MRGSRRAIGLALALVVLAAACSPATPSPTARPPAPTETPAPPAATATAPATAIPEATAPAPAAACTDRSVFRGGLVQAAQGALTSLDGASMYQLDFTVADDYSALTGHEMVCYTNRENVPLTEVYLRTFPNIAGGKLTVAAVKVDGRDVAPSMEAENTSLRVPLPAALQPGARAVIDMDFTVEIAKEMGGNYGLFGYFDDVLVLDTFYPTIPAYDEHGWYRDVPPRNGDLPYYDASFYVVRVTVPADLVVVASGREVAREENGGRRTLTFAAGPARDFYLAGSTKFTVVSKTAGETTINSYSVEGHDQAAQQALNDAERALQSFGARFGAYPYTELDVVSTPMRALGVEYPGVTAIALTLYDPGAVISGTPATAILESVVAHEVAHQWFYNVVGNDQAREPWLDEAMAQYVTYLYYLDADGQSAANQYRESWLARWQRVDDSEIPIGLPSGDYDPNEYGAIVYGRGPLFVEALAAKMGQGSFDAFLRDYVATERWQLATGATFRQMAEKHCGCDLQTLFEKWVYPK